MPLSTYLTDVADLAHSDARNVHGNFPIAQFPTPPCQEAPRPLGSLEGLGMREMISLLLSSDLNGREDRVTA
jgi:hypothetical protein